MEVNNSGQSTLAFEVPYKNFGNAITTAQESAVRLMTEQDIPEEISALSDVECKLSIAGMQLEKGLRRPEQRDAFEKHLSEYGTILKTKLRQDVADIEYDCQQDYVRNEIIASAFRVLDEEMALRRMVSRYERAKAYIAETRTRRAMGSIAVGTGLGVGMYLGIDTFGGAAATGGIVTFFATKGQVVARVAKSVVVSATRTASKQVSHQGSQISQGIINEHVPGEYNGVPMPSGVAGTLEEIDNAICAQLVHPDKDSRLVNAVDAATEILEGKYCPPSLKELYLNR